MRAEKVPQTYLFLIGSALGSAGPPQVTKMKPKGVKMFPGTQQIQFWGRKLTLKCVQRMVPQPQFLSTVAGLGVSQWIPI